MPLLVLLLFVFLISPYSISSDIWAQDNNVSRHMMNHSSKTDKKTDNWFISMFLGKKDRNRSRHHSRIKGNKFNSHMIFGLKEEMDSALSRTEEQRIQFMETKTKLEEQIVSREKELQFLLAEQEKGVDRSKDIVLTYKELHGLCDQLYKSMQLHTSSMQHILSDTYDSYNEKTSKKITEAEQHPEMLVQELLDKYSDMK